MPKVTNFYVGGNVSIPIADDIVKVDISGTIRFTAGEKTDYVYCLFSPSVRKFLIFRKKPFSWGQWEGTTLNGVPYYDYAIVQQSGRVDFFLSKQRKGCFLSAGPDGSFENYLLLDEASRGRVASWKYENKVTVTGFEIDVGLVIILVLVWDRILEDRRRAEQKERVLQKTNAATVEKG